LPTIRKYDGKVPKKDRVWLSRCVKMAAGQATLRTRGHIAARTNASGHTPVHLLRRLRNSQGAPYKCALLRELLFDWFVDIRRSCATTISPRFVLMKARQLADVIVEAQRETDTFELMPTLDRHWLLRFKRDKGIVFRRPNLRFKCSRPKLLARLRAMWANVFRIRKLAELCFGNDLADRIYGIDEKPIHFNESGSKNVRTLEICGAPAVKLKQNHAATRERVSVMTCVCSSAAVATQARKLPIELLFKAKSEKRTRALKAPPDMNMSFQWADKGSYRQLHIIQYFARWLDVWSPARAASNDYRIVMLDVAGSHIGDDVVDFCWTRGYIALFHYGCTTGVAQVNDTDLHGPFERVYCETEQDAFNEQQVLRPGSVARTAQNVVDDVGATWRMLEHKQAAAGHRRVALSVPLDGSDDQAISREALECWTALDMATVRREVIAEVVEKVASGLVSFADWRSLVVHPVDPGVLADEGMEFEGDLEGCAWEDEADIAAAKADDAETLNTAEAELAGPIVESAPGDSEVAVAAADSSAKRLKWLKRLRDETRAAGVPGAFNSIDREVSQLERGRHKKTPLALDAQRILRRHVEAKVDEERKTVAARRAATRKSDLNVRRTRARMAKAKRLKKLAAASKAALHKKIEALPKVVCANSCAEPGNKGLKARVNALERLKLRSPPLPFAERIRWEAVRDVYAKWLAKKFKEKSVGPAFVNKLNEVLKGLGCHYKGNSKFNKKEGCGGDVSAFQKFFREMEKAIPSQATTALM
jgi:hypothetical protein